MTTMEKIETGVAETLLVTLPVNVNSDKKKSGWFRNMSEAIHTEITVLVAELIALTSNCQERFERDEQL
jgi:hypothetical protein